MPTLVPSPEVARLQAAVAALEAEHWRDGASLLIAQLDHLVDQGLHAHEATARALLAQALHALGQPDDGAVQARAALAAAERTDDRALIHRCMALVETFRILATEGL